MKIGTWIHDHDDLPLDQQMALAAENGLQTVRSYHIAYAEKVAPALTQTGMSLFADMFVDAEALVQGWRSQVRLDELARYHELAMSCARVAINPNPDSLRLGSLLDWPTSSRPTANGWMSMATRLRSPTPWRTLSSMIRGISTNGCGR
jgi:hypothetical protein